MRIGPQKKLISLSWRPLFVYCFLVGLFCNSPFNKQVKVMGSVKNFSQIGMQTLGRMKSAGNRGLLKSSLQVLHAHVLLVTPLGTGYMAQPDKAPSCFSCPALSGLLWHISAPLYSPPFWMAWERSPKTPLTPAGTDSSGLFRFPGEHPLPYSRTIKNRTVPALCIPHRTGTFCIISQNQVHSW